jgi:hypothetical protein
MTHARFTGLLLLALATYTAVHFAQPDAMMFASDWPVRDRLPLPDRPVRLAHVRPILGFALNVHAISDLDLYRRAIDRMVQANANAMILVTPMYQQDVAATEIRRHPLGCPTRDQLITLIRYARQRGLHVSLMPIVLLETTGDGHWRGVIQPRDWKVWWTSYDSFIDYYLAIAEASSVDLLVVGSELNSTEDQIERWRHVIARVRASFDGDVAYSANWDRFDVVPFWPEVDVMGVSSYFELELDEDERAALPDPDVAQPTYAQVWAQERDRMLAIARAHAKPLLLTEVGYPSLPWAAAHPWNYMAPADQVADHAAQARCYKAFFSAWSGAMSTPRMPIAGMYCYKWDPDQAGGQSDTGYGLEGKPSLEIVTKQYAAIQQRARKTMAYWSKARSGPDS